MERFFLARDEAVLVVVDVQERLAAVMEKREEVTGRCLHLIEAAKVLGMPVVVTEQYPQGLGPTVKPIRDCLPSPSAIEKTAFSCCDVPLFMKALKDSGRKKVVLAGMETHICVWQTTLGLLANGYHVHLARDAVCSRTEGNWRTGLELARDAGAAVSSTETVLFQLLGQAGTEEFRAISKMLK